MSIQRTLLKALTSLNVQNKCSCISKYFMKCVFSLLLKMSIDSDNQGRCQGVCLGGGGAKWQNISLSSAPALKKSLSEGGGGGGGGGESDTFVFLRPKFLWQNYYHNGVGVLSSSPYTWMSWQNHRGAIARHPLTPRLQRVRLIWEVCSTSEELLMHNSISPMSV